MSSISALLNRIANWKSLLLFFGIYMFFNGYILKNAEQEINGLAGKKVGVIDLTFGFDPEKTLGMVADYGDAARDYYARTEMTADVAYPAVYAFFFGIILTLLYRNSSLAWLNRLPFYTLLLDFAENVFIILLLKQYPAQNPMLATLCEVFKLLKWIFFGAIILLILGGLLRKLASRTKTNTALGA